MSIMNVNNLYNDTSMLIYNIVVFALKNDKPLMVIDFMNITRERGLDSVNDLGNALNNINSIKYGNKIFIHKNPEGIPITQHAINTMLDFTSVNHDSVIIYCVYTTTERLKGEGFKSMKARYKRDDKPTYVMYSRDDCVIYTMMNWLRINNIYPELWSKDKFQDIAKYKYIQPFCVYLFIQGYMYKFVFNINLANF